MCDHEVRFSASGRRFLDSNIIMFASRFACVKCGQQFRVLGVPEGMTHEAPCCVGEGEVTVFPLVPMDEEPQTVRIGRC